MKAIVFLALFGAACSAPASLFLVSVDVQVWVSTPNSNQFDFSNQPGFQFDNSLPQNNATANAVTIHGTRPDGIHHIITDQGTANPGPIYDSRADANSADGQEFDLSNFTGRVGAPANFPVTLSFDYTWNIKLASNTGEAAAAGFSLLLAGTVIDTESFQIGANDYRSRTGAGGGVVSVTLPAGAITRSFFNAVASGWATAPPTPAATPEPSSLLGLALPIALVWRHRRR